MALDMDAVLSILFGIVAMICSILGWYYRRKELQQRLSLLEALSAGDKTKLPEAIELWEKDAQWNRKMRNNTEYASNSFTLLHFYRSMMEWKPAEKEQYTKKALVLMTDLVKTLEQIVPRVWKKTGNIRYLELCTDLWKGYIELSSLDKIQSGQHLEKALNLIREANEYFPTDKYPTVHGIILGANASTLYAMAVMQDPEKNLLEARRILVDGLSQLDRLEKPSGHKELFKILAGVNISLSNLKGEKDFAKEAIDIIQKALQYETPDYGNKDYYSLIVDLRNAHVVLAALDDRGLNLNKALEISQKMSQNDGIRVKRPYAHGAILCTIGNIRMELATVENREDNLQKAIKSYKDGLAISEFRSDSGAAARVRNSLQKAERMLRGEEESISPPEPAAKAGTGIEKAL